MTRKTVSLVFVLVVASYSSLMLWAANVWAFPHPERLVVVIAALWAVGALYYLAALRITGDGMAALGGALIWTLLIGTGGNFFESVSPVLVGGIVLLVPVGVTVLFVRLSASRVREAIVIGVLIFLVSGPLLTLASGITGDESQSEVLVSAWGRPLPVELSDRPDIFLVIVDGFVGTQGLQGTYDIEANSYLSGLRASGFEIVDSAWAPYALSIASIPSLLEMNYLVSDSGVIGDQDFKDLGSIVSGDNALVATLKSQGYEIVMIESGWGYSYCGSAVDRCYASAFLDEGTFFVIRESVIGPYLTRTFGSAFTVGSVGSMGTLLSEAPMISSDEIPTLVFGHLMIPHPPLYLDSQCGFVYEEDRSGLFLYGGPNSLEQRKGAYLAQGDCVLSFLQDLSSRIDPDDLIVVVGDHGSDSANQLRQSPESWSDAATVERMNVLLAIRSSTPCEQMESVVIPEVMARVLACLDPDYRPTLEQRLFRGRLLDNGDIDFVEMDGAQVSELLEPISSDEAG